MYPRSKQRVDGKCIKLGFGLLVLIPAYVALLYLRRHEAHLLLTALLVTSIWAADVGAYFVGRQFGTTKLAPNVSPGKSWEGLVGGVIIALAIGTLGASLAEPSHQLFSPVAWFVLPGIVVITVLFSVLGDLFESLIKREQGVKDSSSLLPGHGGVMDRIDSLTAATPVFALSVHLRAGRRMTIGVALFGATGSIGESTLSVIEAYPERFHLEVVSAHSSVDKLVGIIERFHLSM